MKIAIVSIRFDRKGGSERRACHLAKGLMKAGHAVEIFAATVEDSELDAPVNIVPVSPGPSFVKVTSFTKNVSKMLASRTDIDVVHNQIRPFTDGVVTVGGGCHAEYLERTGKTLSIINPLHRVILGLERERYRMGGCRAIIANSGLARDGILKHYDFPEELVFVAYNGVDSDRFSPSAVAARRDEIRGRLGLGDGPVALFVGKGFERKGLRTAIKAAAKLKAAPGAPGPLKLVVVGGDEPRPFAKLARKLGVADRVVFTGAVTGPEYYYGAADMFVLPTLYDPFANAALEAMACGLPVITTYQNGVREIIRDGESGFLMEDPDDHMRLAGLMEALLDPDTRASVGSAARRAARGMTWDATIGKTLDVYGKVY